MRRTGREKGILKLRDGQCRKHFFKASESVGEQKKGGHLSVVGKGSIGSPK